MSLQEVYITDTSIFMPNEPVTSEEMEAYLGFINEKPSKSRKIVLRNNGIQTRYYALTKDGKAGMARSTRKQISWSAPIGLIPA